MGKKPESGKRLELRVEVRETDEHGRVIVCLASHSETYVESDFQRRDDLCQCAYLDSAAFLNEW